METTEATEVTPMAAKKKTGKRKSPKKSVRKPTNGKSDGKRLSASDLKPAGGKKVQVAIRMTESGYQSLLVRAKAKGAPGVAQFIRSELGLA